MRATLSSRSPWNIGLLALSCLFSARLSAGGEIERPSDIFRNIFYTLAREQYSDDDIHKLIYAPHEEFISSRALQGEGETAFDARAESWAPIKPSELYAKGRETPFALVRDPDEALQRRPITILIIPGIFGEFITHSPFHEVLAEQGSAFAKQWKAGLAAKPTKDAVFDLETLAEAETDLGQLTEVASLDNAGGQDLIRVIYLKPLFGSLETLGTLEDSSAVYLRRINKIRAVLGGFENLYIMGYSRGLNVALDLVNKAEKKPEAYPWFGELKGVISLGGTLYGSPLADAAFKPGKPTCEALARLNQLAADLVVLPPDASLGDKVQAVAANAAAWASAGSDLLAIGAKMETPEGLKVENARTDSLNLGAFGELLKTVIYEKFKIIEGSEFNNNVEKFRWLMREITEGAQSITRANSLEWQRTHTIPSHLRYFVIQATMGDPSSEKAGPSELSRDSVSINTKTIDYAALRRSYYDYWLDTGAQLNDSQTSPDRTVFWPALHQNLNPEQKPFPTHLLALLGVDHWGMSFPVALESRNEEVSPYPRTLLLHALGAYLAQDSQER